MLPELSCNSQSGAAKSCAAMGNSEINRAKVAKIRMSFVMLEFNDVSVVL